MKLLYLPYEECELSSIPKDDFIEGTRLPIIKINKDGKLRGSKQIEILENNDFSNQLLFLPLQNLNISFENEDVYEKLLKYLERLLKVSPDVLISSKSYELISYIKTILPEIKTAVTFSKFNQELGVDYIINPFIDNKKTKSLEGVYNLLLNGFRIIDYWPTGFYIDSLEFNEYITKIIENNLLDRIYFITHYPKETKSYILSRGGK